MPATKRLMDTGDFTIQLAENTPGDLIDTYAISSGGYGTVIITPVWIDPTNQTVADLLAASCFTGQYLEEDGDADRYTSLKGAHASGWLGDTSGQGPMRESGGPFSGTSQAALFWTQVIAGIGGGTTDSPFPLAIGTVDNIGSLTWAYDWTVSAATARAAFDYVCPALGVEWRVNDDLTLDIRTPSNLYGSTPTVIVTPWWQGRDGGLTAVRATIKPSANVINYANRVLANVFGGIGVSVASPYTDPQGNSMFWKRQINPTASTNLTDATAQANASLSSNDRAASVPTITTDQSAVMADVEVGSFIYVFFPSADLHGEVVLGGQPTQLWYRGQPVWPAQLRVQAITMAIVQGMGVYFCLPDGTIADFTRFVVWESASSTIEVGPTPVLLTTALVPHGGVVNV